MNSIIFLHAHIHWRTRFSVNFAICITTRCLDYGKRYAPANRNEYPPPPTPKQRSDIEMYIAVHVFVNLCVVLCVIELAMLSKTMQTIYSSQATRIALLLLCVDRPSSQAKQPCRITLQFKWIKLRRATEERVRRDVVQLSELDL